MTTDDEALRNVRAVWSAGDYRESARLLAPAADRLVSALGIAADERVLDVGTGTGNVALAAARQGARVAGVDLSPRMLERARERAGAEGLAVAWYEGDLGDLPFADGGFDVAASAFAVMLAVDRSAAVAELARVLRPGGRLGLASWGPGGALGRMATAMRAALDRGPDAPDPRDWGQEAVVRDLLGDCFTDVSCEAVALPLDFASESALRVYLTDQSPPHVATRDALGERYPALLDQLVSFAAPIPGGLRYDGHYLLATATRAAG